MCIISKSNFTSLDKFFIFPVTYGEICLADPQILTPFAALSLGHEGNFNPARMGNRWIDAVEEASHLWSTTCGRARHTYLRARSKVFDKSFYQFFLGRRQRGGARICCMIVSSNPQGYVVSSNPKSWGCHVTMYWLLSQSQCMPLNCFTLLQTPTTTIAKCSKKLKICITRTNLRTW